MLNVDNMYVINNAIISTVSITRRLYVEWFEICVKKINVENHMNTILLH